MRPELVMKSVIPVVMAGIIGRFVQVHASVCARNVYMCFIIIIVIITSLRSSLAHFL